MTKAKLPVKTGDYVFGQLTETEGLEFTWAIVDPTNLGLMGRGRTFRGQRGEEDIPTAAIDWQVLSDGPWFLAFDATRKQYIRHVRVELWRRRRTS